MQYQPQPIHAVLLLFPSRGKLAEERKEEEKRGEGVWEGSKKENEEGGVWWIKQLVCLVSYLPSYYKSDRYGKSNAGTIPIFDSHMAMALRSAMHAVQSLTYVQSFVITDMQPLFFLSTQTISLYRLHRSPPFPPEPYTVYPLFILLSRQVLPPISAPRSLQTRRPPRIHRLL